MNYRRWVGFACDKACITLDSRPAPDDTVLENGTIFDDGAGMNNRIFKHGIFFNDHIMGNNGVFYFAKDNAAITDQAVGYLCFGSQVLGMTAHII